VYGLRGLAGNVSDWCEEVSRAEGPVCAGGRAAADPGTDQPSAPRVLRGGKWLGILAFARACSRYWRDGRGVDNSVGARLARPFR
jgi:serine/threonine-protein kinase